MLDYNFHTHTFRCGHATGSEREYIETAIAAGIKRMGFSEHAPFKFSDGTESDFRVPTALTSDYFDTLRALREEYKEKIEILIGFELEYYPALFDKMFAYTKNAGAEYLILGQHFLDESEKGEVRPSKETTLESTLVTYTDRVTEAMERKLFTYVAHPDLCRFVGDHSIWERETRRILETSVKTGTPLEINFLGIRDRRHYPNERFWELAGNLGAPVTFGMDAHDVAAAGDLASYAKAMALVEKYGLNYIGAPDIIKI